MIRAEFFYLKSMDLYPMQPKTTLFIQKAMFNIGWYWYSDITFSFFLSFIDDAILV